MAEDTIVNMFWHGPRLPPLAWACMRSFVERGHRLRVFSYSKPALPPGAELADARAIMPADSTLAEQDRIAEFADLFRYTLLYRHGGWWVDSDVFCLTERLPAEPYAWAEQEPGIVNNAILKFPKGDGLARRLVKTAEKKRKRKKHNWGALGPDLATDVLGKRGVAEKSGTTATFYPWNWFEAFLIWFPWTRQDVLDRARGALFLHFWDSTLRRMGLDVFRDPPPGSFWADIIAGAPGRTPGDVAYFRAAEATIRAFCEKHGPPRRWPDSMPAYADTLSSAP